MLRLCWDESHALGVHAHDGEFHRMTKVEQQADRRRTILGLPTQGPRPVRYFRPADKHHPHRDHDDPSRIQGWFCCGAVQLGLIGMNDCAECGEPFPCPDYLARHPATTQEQA